MSGAKGPLLLVAGGCAAMLGAAALTVSLGSFFADLPTTKANAAVVADLPVKKVKTVSLKPTPVEASTATAPNSRPQPAAKPAPAAEQPVVAAAAPDEEELHQADPRWARATEPGRDAAEQSDQLEAAFAAQNEESSANTAAAQELERRSGESVAMLSNTDDDANASAVTPVIEDKPAEAPKKRVQQDDEAAQEPARADGRTVTINSGVNLRSSGRSGSKVIGTVPSGARVTLSSDCRDWCRVTYNGRTGYVWRQFVNGAGGVSKSRTRRAAKQTEEQAPVEASNTEPGLFGNDGVINNDGAAGSARARAGAAQAAAAAAAKKPEKPGFVPPDR